MDEIRCPVCGMNNKPDAESCDYCGAPFTHLDSSIDPGDRHAGLGSGISQDSALQQGGDIADDAEDASDMLIFEPDVSIDFVPEPDAGDPDLPALWLKEEEWFDRMEVETAGETPDETAAEEISQPSVEDEDGERLPEWLFQALENEGQNKRQRAETQDDAAAEEPLFSAEQTDTAQSLVGTEDGLPVSDEEYTFAEILADTEEKEGLPAWLENMSVDEEQLARASGMDDTGEADDIGSDEIFSDEDEYQDMPADDHVNEEIDTADSAATVAGEVEETGGGDTRGMPAWLAGLSGKARSVFRRGKEGHEPQERSAETHAFEESVSQSDAEQAAAVEMMQEAGSEHLRPDDGSAESREPEADIEESGPLAGLRGVLAGDEVVTQYSTPPAYSNKLRASEKQKKDVMLLKQMLARETRPQPLAPVERPGSLRLGRMVTGIFLILIVLLPIVAGFEQIPVPDLYPIEAVAFHHYIESLPEDRPVLLAMEYQPALAGEMQPAVQLVMQHLMERKSRLALVSTVPAGPVIGYDLLLQAQTSYPTYNLNSRFINLGYLPGEETGVKSFALQPQRTTRYGFDISHNGARAWQHSALNNVFSLNDFALIIVMAGDLDSGRAWVEQAQPLLQDTPLLVVSSAQASPLLLPYYDSDQIQGLISGLSGAAAYEQLCGLPGMVKQYWASYQYGIFALVLLVLLGIPLQLFVMPNLKSDKKKKRA